MLCLHSCRDPEEVTAMNEEKMLDDYMEMLKKEFNLRMNKGAYYVKEEQLVAGDLIHNPYSYVLYSYNIPRYKSEFFYNREVIHVEYPPTKFRFEGGDRLIWPLEFEALKDIPFFNKTTKSRLLLEIIDYYGLRPYLWSSLIYDKSKGNDFEKIEKILKKHGIKYDKKVPVGVSKRTWVCGTMLKESNDESFEKNLRSKNMLKNHALAISISDVGWRSFLQKLDYKANLYNRTVISVNPKNTTQTCYACGFIMGTNGTDKLNLKDREWTCPNCHEHHIRDWNAAKNILAKGLDKLEKPKNLAKAK